MATMFPRRSLVTIVVCGRVPACTAAVNFAMKSLLGMFSCASSMPGCSLENIDITSRRPFISV